MHGYETPPAQQPRSRRAGATPSRWTAYRPPVVRPVAEGASTRVFPRSGGKGFPPGPHGASFLVSVSRRAVHPRPFATRIRIRPGACRPSSAARPRHFPSRWPPARVDRSVVRPTMHWSARHGDGARVLADGQQGPQGGRLLRIPPESEHHLASAISVGSRGTRGSAMRRGTSAPPRAPPPSRSGVDGQHYRYLRLDTRMACSTAKVPSSRHCWPVSVRTHSARAGSTVSTSDSRPSPIAEKRAIITFRTSDPCRSRLRAPVSLAACSW